VEFDGMRGLGAVEGDDGTRHDFHCTRIADGTRTVPIGARVCYVVVPGSLGHWEAAGIEVISAG
jgi:hypothetical protein